MTASINLHRLFGMALTEFFIGLPFVVEVEKDLSQRQQLLDVVVIRREQDVVDAPMPSGFEDLAEHNLITFKSQHEALDDWALKELTGHYVNYRKLLSQHGETLITEINFRL